MRRYLPLCLLVALLPLVTGCGESPNRPSVVTETPRNPPKTNARFIQTPWDISLFFNLPGGAVVAGATTAATSGAAAPGDNLTGTFVNSNGFAGAISGVLTGTLESGNFDGTLSTITRTGCTAERRFSGPITTQGLNWSPGTQVNDCGGTSPLTSGIQAAAAAPTAPPPCTYTATATGTSVPTAGGTGAVSVEAGTGCAWFATSSESFVTLSASQGTAAGSVQFTVAANTSTTQRTAVLVVAGSSFTITQAAAPVCTYRLNGRERTFDASGALGGVDMRVAPGCAWQAQSDAPWLTITSGASGSGDGTISYTVAANSGLTQRVGRITATRDELLTITQLGIVCQFTLTSATTAVPFGGGNGTIQVVPNVAACPWTATVSPAAPWITITAGGAGTGNGTVALNFAANPTAQPRVGTVSVGTAVVTLTQAPTTLGSMTGLITNSLNKLPIANATVTITPIPQGAPLTTTTNAAGVYTFASVQQGSYNVLIHRPAFGDVRGPAPVSILAAQTTTFNAALTPNPVNFVITWNPNPTSVNSSNVTCGLLNVAFCWQSTITIQETSGTTAPVTALTLHFFDPAGAPSFSVAGTGTPFTIQGGTTLQSTGTATLQSPAGGGVEFEFAGTDAFGRTFSIRSPRLGLNPFVVPGVPGIGALAGQPSVTGVIRQGGGVQPAAPSSGTIRR
jgi:carboxypeptidase family protein/all-beta uncharacterized protein/BACON domain-containing protein